jgi:hypothetical protein
VQRRYNYDGRFYLTGSYGRANNRVGTWVSHVRITDPAVAVVQEQVSASFSIYPNPVSDFLRIRFVNPNSAMVHVQAISTDGKFFDLYSEEVNKGEWVLMANVSGLSNGIYQCRVSSGGELIFTLTFQKN